MQYLQEYFRAFLVSVGRISTLKEKINRFYKAGTDWVNIDAIYEYHERHHRWHKERGDHECHEKAAKISRHHIFYHGSTKKI